VSPLEDHDRSLVDKLGIALAVGQRDDQLGDILSRVGRLVGHAEIGARAVERSIENGEWFRIECRVTSVWLGLAHIARGAN
jgi:hypothetical protein